MAELERKEKAIIFNKTKEFNKYAFHTLLWYASQLEKASTDEINLTKDFYTERELIRDISNKNILYVEKDMPYARIWFGDKKRIDEDAISHGAIIRRSFPAILLVNRERIDEIIDILIRAEKEKIEFKKKKFENSFIGKICSLINKNK